MVIPVVDMPNERKLCKYAAYLSRCSREVTDYGKCVGEKAGKVTHLACQREFVVLLSCVEKQDITDTVNFYEMKVKRYKRAKRIISIYRYNFGLEPPYEVLLDGTFAMAALQNKINLREQLPKYLNAEVDIRVTNCVLKELEKLGSTLYGALHICKQFDVVNCPHQPIRTAVECIKHMARRMKHGTTYFFATQELEKPKDQLLELSKLKKAIFGKDERPRRKRKGPKGPNPLSVKKKKIRLINTDQKLKLSAKTDAPKRYRRRRRKKANESH
ncbi:rRNA-processing protein [Dirofilaria immitis]